MTNKYFSCLLISFILIVLFTILAKADIKPDDDMDYDGYDFNGDGNVNQTENYTNKEEYNEGTNPTNPDTDGDEMIDGWEVYFGLNPLLNDSQNDTDNDGLTNIQEWNWNLTGGMNLSSFAHATNPASNDTDEDGIPDKWEIDNGFHPKENDSYKDPDNDFLTNLQEYKIGTNPHNPDTDGDGLIDSEDPYPLVPEDNRKIVIYNGSTTKTVDTFIIFDPSLDSMKRGSAVNAVDTIIISEKKYYYIYVSNTTKNQFSLTNYNKYSHVYEGVWDVKISQNYTPIASVSPDAKILRYYAEGEEIDFYKDCADNFYVKTNFEEEKEIPLAYTLVTNGSYFDLTMDNNLTTNDVPEGLLIKPPQEILDKVDWFLNYSKDETLIYNLIGEKNFTKILNNLTTYFSNFSSGDIPEENETRDIYQTIAVNKIGASWHRCFAFFVTANALGIPTRYVQEIRTDEKSHENSRAFSEVYIPKKGEDYNISRWKRIDLGFSENINKITSSITPNGQLVTNVSIIEASNLANKTETFEIKGVVKNINYVLIPYLPLTIFVNETERGFKAGFAKTDENGEFNLTCFVPNGLQSGLRDLIVRVNTTHIFKGSFSKPKKIEIYAHTNLTSILQKSVGKGNDLNIFGSLKDITLLPLESQIINITWDNESIGDANTDFKGDFYFTYKVPEECSSGEHYVNITFNKTKYLYKSNLTKIVNVKKGIKIYANLSTNKTRIGENITVNGSITDEENNPMNETGNITATLGGLEIGRVFLTEKYFEFNCTIPINISAGNYNLTISYIPNKENEEKYPEATVFKNLTVTGILTYITMESKNVIRGEYSEISGKLWNQINNIGIDSKEIKIYWNNSAPVTSTTNSDGEFSYNYLIPTDDFGEVEVKTAFEDDEHYLGSNNTTKFNVFAKTYISLSVYPLKDEIYRNTTIYINGSLVDDLGKNLKEMDIELYSDLTGYIEENKTNDDGNFIFKYDVAPNHLPTTINFIVKFAGSGFYLKSDDASVEYIIKAKTLLNFSISTNVTIAGEKINILGNLTDENSIGLKKTLKLIFEDYTKYFSSNDDGNFSVDFTIPDYQRVGSYELRIEFLGEMYYEHSINSKIIKVKRTTNITINELELFRNEIAYIDGTLYTIFPDKSKEHIKNANVSFYWEMNGDKKYIGSNNTTEDGKFICEYNLSEHKELGLVNITVAFNGNDFYLNSSKGYNGGVLANTSIEFNSKTVFRGRKITVDGHVFEGKSPYNGTIFVYWNENIKSNKTNDEGYFTVDFEINNTHKLGGIEVTAKLDPADIDTKYCLVNESRTNYTVWAETSIKFYNSFKKAYRNKIININGTFKEGGEGRRDVKIDIFWNNSYLISTTTKTKGKFSYNHSVENNETLGEVIVEIRLNDTNYSLPDYCTQYFNKTTYEVWAHTNLTLNVTESGEQKIVIIGGQFEVWGNLKDDLGKNMNENIMIYFGTKSNSTKTIDGDFSVIFNVSSSLPAVEYDIKANYISPPTAFYESAEVTLTKIVVVRRTTNLTIFPKAVYRGEKVTIVGKLLDNMNEGFIENVTIKWNGTDMGKAQTEKNGNFYLEHWDNESLGKIAIIAIFEDSKFYTNSQNSTNYTVLANTTINLFPKQVFRNKFININGTVIENEKLPTKFLPLNITWNKNIFKNSTDENGNFSVEHFINKTYPLGDVNVSLDFNGSIVNLSLYLENHTTTIYTVFAKTNINLTTPSVGFLGKNLTIFGNLTNDLGNGLKNTTVKILINKDIIEKDVGTDDNGSFNITFEIPSNLNPGLHNLTVKFDGEDYYYPSNNSVEIYLNNLTKIDIDSLDERFRNNTVEITGTLEYYDKYYDYIGFEGYVDFYWMNKLIGYNMSNSKGEFSFEYFVDKNHKLGEFEIKVIFNETDEYTKTENKTSIIIRANTVLTLSKEYKEDLIRFRNDEIVIMGNVTEEYSKGDVQPVPNLLIDLLWDNTWQNSTKTKANGSFSFCYKINETQLLGDFKLKIIFNDTDYYEDYLKTIDVIVKNRTRINLDSKVVVRNNVVKITGSFDASPEVLDPDINIIWNIEGFKKAIISNNTFYFEKYISSSHDNGKVNVTAMFNEKKSLFVNSTNTTYTVLAGSKIIIKSIEPEIVVAGNELKIEGKIETDKGDILDGNIIIYLDEQKIITDKTKNGFFSALLTLDNNIAAGYHNITINTTNFDTSFFANSSSTKEILIKGIVNIEMDEIQTFRDKKINIQGNVFDNADKKLDGYVHIHWDNKFKGNSSVIKGYFVFEYYIPKGEKLGLVNVSACFQGTKFYDEVNYTVNYTIRGKSRLSLIFPKKIIRGEKFQAQVILVDEFDNGIPNMEIFVEYKGIRISLNTNKNGKAYFSATIFDEKVTFTASFDGYDKYGNVISYLDKSELSKPVISELPLKEKESSLLLILAVISIAVVCLGSGAYTYVWKKKQPKKVVIEPLIKGDTPVVIAKRAYQKVCRALRKFGFTRKTSQTFREFERNVTQKIRVDKQSMGNVTDVYEELVYSKHPISKKKADDADLNSGKVEKSLQGNLPQKKRKKIKTKI